MICMKLTKINIFAFLFTALFALVVGFVMVQSAYAQSDTDTTTPDIAAPDHVADNPAAASIAQMMETLKTLMERVRELQEQLAQIRGEVRDILSDGIREGVASDEVRDIQELLATDPSIYPEGYTTGYFGPLTREAIKRFQKRYGLEETGEIDDETKELLEEYFEEREDEGFPPGLLRAEDVKKRVTERVCEKRKKLNVGAGMGMTPRIDEMCNMMEDDDDDMSDATGMMDEDDMDSEDGSDDEDDTEDDVDDEGESDEDYESDNQNMNNVVDMIENMMQ